MLIKDGCEYQFNHPNGMVQYFFARRLSRLNREKGPMFRLGAHVFEENGRKLRMDSLLLEHVPDENPRVVVSEVNPDTKRRYEGGKAVDLIREELGRVLNPENSAPFFKGTASDEILAQVQEVLQSMITLRMLLEGARS